MHPILIEIEQPHLHYLYMLSLSHLGMPTYSIARLQSSENYVRCVNTRCIIRQAYRHKYVIIQHRQFTIMYESYHWVQKKWGAVIYSIVMRGR